MTFTRKWWDDLVEKPLFSYLTILLLQLKVAWGIWYLRDLTSGDTSSYFLNAYDWYKNLRVEIVWSPIYTAFYGTFLHLSTDAYVATMAHRLTIILVLALLVLALMRQILPAGAAWLMAAWWVILPVDFDAMYEVHMFSIVPMIAALLVIALKPGPWGRGCGIAILFAATFLVRNELLLPTGCLAVLAIGWEVVRRRRGEQDLIAMLKQYGVPLVMAALAILLTFTRSNHQQEIRQILDAKHRLNVCQVYTYSYQQRHSEWKGSPWTECQQLMATTFGKPEPSFGEALRANPRAMWEHLTWNAGLIPNGLQVLLFNSTSGRITPDFAPVTTNSSWALMLTALVGAILIVGGALLWRARDGWPREGRGWVWVGMLCLALMVFVVAILERPRPEYMYSLGLVLRAAVGACLVAIVSRFPARRRFAAALPFAFLLVIALAPGYHPKAPAPARPLLESYRRLRSVQEVFEGPNVGLVSREFPFELCSYVTGSISCRPLALNSLRGEAAGSPLSAVLAKNRATLFYADEAVLSDPAIRDFVDSAAQYGWQTVAAAQTRRQDWRLLASQEKIDIVPVGSSVRLGKGWYDHETFAGGEFRWVSNDAEFYVERPDFGSASLAVDIEGGPNLAGRPMVLEVFADGKVIGTVSGSARQTAHLHLPTGSCKEGVTVRLHVTASPVSQVRGESRVLNFRVFDIAVIRDADSSPPHS
ncbi:MAG TPA: hypothetical protein VKF41_07960 [Bryobacteraceae bacterium]|nr:hypothetical protein [Bryobacteraceae bacterium]